MSEGEELRILVVEDEVAIQRGLCDVLAYHGYRPTAVGTGEEGLREGLTNGYDAVLLDVMLPGVSGFDVCRELREGLPRLPILMLTARGSEEDVLRGFREGSDDYLTKPFSIAELLARIEALLRRAGKGGEPARLPFVCGPFRIDPEARLAQRTQKDGKEGKDGERVELTRREIDMLALFVEEPGRIVSRRALLRRCWGFESPEGIETRTVDMHIAKLRKKLGEEGRRLIETVRGEGYRLGGAG